MTVPEIWREQNHGGKKNERELNHIESPTGIANERKSCGACKRCVSKEVCWRLYEEGE